MNKQEKTELVKYRIAKARQTLNEVPILIQSNFLNNAINRLYYACFYGVSALLLDRNIQAKSHAGTKQMFGLHFVKTGILTEEANDFFKLVFELRHTGDYDDYIVFDLKEVTSLLQPATDFITQIEAILSKD